MSHGMVVCAGCTVYEAELRAAEVIKYVESFVHNVSCALALQGRYFLQFHMIGISHVYMNFIMRGGFVSFLRTFFVCFGHPRGMLQ